MPLHIDYRPITLEEVIGNDSIKDSLSSIFARTSDFPHAFLFYGPSGSGKCITGDSFIITEKGIENIHNYSNNKLGFSDCKIKILTHLGMMESNKVFEEETKETIKIKNDLGMELEGTPEHPILILESTGNIVFQKLKYLKKGDVVCVNRKGFFPTTNKKIDFYFVKKNRHDTGSHELKNIPKEVNTELARLLGYLIANSSFNGSNSLQFSSKNEKIRADLSSILKNMEQTIGPLKEGKDFTIGGIRFYKFILHLLNESKFPTARYKKVPTCILEGTKEIQSSFIKGLFDCDSWLNLPTSIEYCSASKVLINQIQMMLLNFGIISRLSSKTVKGYDHVYYDLKIYGEDVDLYFEEIGSNLKNYVKKSRNTNKDIVPIKEHIITIINNLKESLLFTNGYFSYKGKKVKGKIGYITHTNQKEQFTYPTLTRFCNVLFEFVKTIKLEDPIIFKEMQNIKVILEKHFYFSKITEVSVLNDPKKVYDFSIPTYHSFITNGYISHNTTFARIIGKLLKVDGSDFIEYNSAETRGIDAVREIDQNCRYAPLDGNFKIYLLDEFHRMTGDAQSALLKIIEDAPKHVIFLLCTTEPEKVLKTIRTRCMMYQTKLLIASQMTKLLKWVLKKEKLEDYPESIIKEIVKASEGCPRQALVLLDSVIDIESEQKAIEAISNFVSSETSVIDICRLLLSSDKNKWVQMKELIKGLEEEPETVRYAILGYLTKVLLGGTNDKVADMMELFFETWMYSKKAGMVYSLYQASKF